MAAGSQKNWRDEPVATDIPGGDRATNAATDAAAASARMQTALDLFTMGMDMLRARLRRENPAWSTEELELRIERWLQTRRGAEGGDGQGRSVPWPRTKR